MSTPHISAPPGAFAPLVLLPGDPLRARHVATTLLTDAVEVTAVRNMLGYTGTWRGQRVSVMGSGMGIPSASLYAAELFREYGVRRLVRIGTCGAVASTLALGDLVLAQGACTDSNVNRVRFRGYDYAPLASWALLHRVAVCATAERARGVLPPVHVGNVFSSDSFYHPDPEFVPLLARYGVLAVEMEAAGLYATAAEHGAEALAVLTVSDHVGGGDHMTPAERQTGVDRMARLVLDALTDDAC
jgi:purine-nucleoside phosphorylase